MCHSKPTGVGNHSRSITWRDGGRWRRSQVQEHVRRTWVGCKLMYTSSPPTLYFTIPLPVQKKKIPHSRLTLQVCILNTCMRPCNLHVIHCHNPPPPSLPSKCCNLGARCHANAVRCQPGRGTMLAEREMKLRRRGCCVQQRWRPALHLGRDFQRRSPRDWLQPRPSINMDQQRVRQW